VTRWAALVVAAACGAAPAAATTPARAILVVRAPVADAMVWVDDSPVGEVATLPGGIALAPGEHRVELRHDRYHTRYLMVTLHPGEKQAIDVTMAEELW
jgi:hypothetical protein